MKNHRRNYIEPVDVHAALARAHADRGEYIAKAVTALPALVRRVAAKLRPNRDRLPHNGAWA
jgi:hypothetical protein